MAKPSRNASPVSTPVEPRIFFVTSKTDQGKALLQSERMANLLIDVLRRYVAEHKFRVIEFVVMPDHFHILLGLDETMKVEKAVQLIKGNFSFRAKKEFGIQGEIWQRGFSDVRIRTRDSLLNHIEYIRQNPVKAGLAVSAEEYPYCSAYLRKRKKES
jgi:putative transposase